MVHGVSARRHYKLGSIPGLSLFFPSVYIERQTQMTRKVINRGSFVLNLNDANDSTYQTWVDVRLWSDGLVERKCNDVRKTASGGGQRWVAMGYVHRDATGTVMVWEHEKQTRIFAQVVRHMGRKCNHGGFGAAWSNATWVAPKFNKATKRWLYAAPSIANGKPQRNRNRNRMRERANAVDIHDMAARIHAKRK